MKDLIIKDKGELKMLEGLYIKGYRYIAKDEEDNINTYKHKPKPRIAYDIYGEEYKDWEPSLKAIRKNDCEYLDGYNLFRQTRCVCGYDEPLEIAEVLKANGVGIEPCEICKWGKTSVERYIENLVTLDMRDFVDFNYCFNCGRKLEAEE